MVRNLCFFIVIYIGIFLFTSLLISCSSTEEASVITPSDHTVNKKGSMHKTGLTNPMVNCISCHGSDLKGGSSQKSCYACHGLKW